MTASNVTYHEDYYTLRGMTDHFELPVDLIREIQKHGLMLPEIVKFGSEETEIYSNLDKHICRLVQENLGKTGGLSQGIVSAQAHVVEVYREAHGRGATNEEDSCYASRFAPGIQRKKLFLLDELLEALDISEEAFDEMRQHLKIEEMRLQIPGETIEYYLEDDYLRLRYMLTLRDQGCPLEEAARIAYNWGIHELW